MSDRSGATLLYEDDTALADEIVDAFQSAGTEVVRIDEANVLRAMSAVTDDAVLVMDRMVDGADSLNVLEQMRVEGVRIPVVVISSLASVDDRIRGLKAGGDDYLVKPFAMAELLARVEALRRRAEMPRSTIAVGPLLMDLLARSVTLAGRPVALAPREFVLLECLMRHAGKVVTRSMLLEDVWHYRLTTHTNVVDVHVGNLRRKIETEGEPRLIVSVRGIGFMLTAGEGP